MVSFMAKLFTLRAAGLAFGAGLAALGAVLDGADFAVTVDFFGAAFLALTGLALAGFLGLAGLAFAVVFTDFAVAGADFGALGATA
ncbi:hypothetical protein MACH15_15110 [Maricaulis maris]|nr:hypothetical protein MACH15_15110 [Maricaulis maris]